MGLFGTKKAAERYEDRLRGLELLCDEVKRDVRGLCLEYEELYDKVRHQMSRMSKRVAAEKKEQGNGDAFETANETSDGSDPISEAIHERRNRGFLTR